MVESRNKLDTLICSVEGTLKNSGDDLDASLKSDIEEKVKEAKEAHQSDDKSRLDNSYDSLTEEAHRLAEVLYRNVNDAGTQENENDFVDAEIIEEDAA